MHIMLFGTFDRLHDGHRFLLRTAMKRGDVTLIIARDENVQSIKGRRSVQSERERQTAIEQEFPNITVLLGNPDDFLEPIRTHKPDLLLFGYDQKLPPGISEQDLDVPVERAEAFEPERNKSSLQRDH